ncbi:hypothetical protein T03_3704 [Trichinella britovi]|uniref:Uncharacterized protein n=1 Tax=Trichinella britovi TaxID=45882 RepID=A0A0V1CDR6_TRIBR|nr:hypothetical protein T03_3704 [Trichinella britovi]
MAFNCLNFKTTLAWLIWQSRTTTIETPTSSYDVRLVFHQRIEIVSVGRFRQRTFVGQGDFDSTMQKYMFIHKLRVDVAGLGQFSATGDIILPNGVCQMSSTWRVLTYATAPLYAVGYFSQLADFCIILDNFFVVHIAVSRYPSSFAQLFSSNQQRWSVPTCAASFVHGERRLP